MNNTDTREFAHIIIDEIKCVTDTTGSCLLSDVGGMPRNLACQWVAALLGRGVLAGLTIVLENTARLSRGVRT